jgi:hypothetical protein
MALRPDVVLNPYADRVDFFMNQTAERGAIVALSTGGSGVAMESASNAAVYRSSASGAVPLGVLINDVVNYDLTRQDYNPYKNEVQLGSKVHISADCTVVTNMITSGVSPAAGDAAYLAADGRVTNVNTGAIASPLVGRFLSSKDEDGYAKVRVNL